MSYTDFRDFEPELTIEFHEDEIKVAVEKLGGGLIGNKYEGQWRIVAYHQGREVLNTQDYYTGTPWTHIKVARDVYVRLLESEEV